MAAPALHKTWQGGSTPGGTEFVNTLPGSLSTQTLWAIKNALVNFNSNPWTVIGSCDASASGMDAVDRWVDAGDVSYPTNAGDPFSWIVLQQTAIGATYQILLYTGGTLALDPQREHAGFASNSGGYGSASGGSNGAPNSVPSPGNTALNAGLDGSDWVGAENGGDSAKVMTCISSTDGECTRVIISKQSTGIPIAALGWEVPRLPPSTWTTPALSYLFKSTVASGLSCFRWETMANAVTNGEIVANVDAKVSGYTVATMVPMMPMFSSTEVIDMEEEGRPNPMLYPPTLFGTNVTTNANANRDHGSLFDWYWCSRNPSGQHLLDMDSIPLAGDRTFVCTGDNVIGWLDDSATDLNYAKTLTIENALKLDNGEYLSIADGTYAGLNARTCEMWLKIPSADVGGWRGVYGSGDSHWQQYVIAYGNVGSWGDKANDGNVVYNWGDSVWFHIAWVYTTTTREIFINGVSLAAPIAANNVTVSTGTVYLGNTVAGGSTLAIAGSEPCHIADVRHWNFARSGAQILADYQVPLGGNEAGLVAYWPLQNDFSQLVSGGPAAWGIAAGTPTIETGVGPVL